MQGCNLPTFANEVSVDQAVAEAQYPGTETDLEPKVVPGFLNGLVEQAVELFLRERDFRKQSLLVNTTAQFACLFTVHVNYFRQF